MIYNADQVITAFEPLVGFNDAESFTLSASLTGGNLKMNNYHPLLQLSTLDSARPEQLTLSAFLEGVRKSAVTSVLNDLITKKLMSRSLKTKLSDTQVFDSTARFSNLVSKNGRFVGWVFRPNKSEHTFHKISKIAIQTTQAQANIPIYVFHSSQKEPLQTVTIDSLATSVSWTTLDQPIILNYLDQDAGGFYYIGYFEDDLNEGNRAIYKDHDLSVMPCSSCNQFNKIAYRDWSKYVSISTGYVNGNNLDGTDMVSVDKVEIENTTNYGLNFRIETYCDITNLLIVNKGQVAPILQVRYAIELLRYIEMSGTRKNGITDALKDASFVAINGQKSENNFIKVRGMIHDYEDYLNGLNFDLSLLDPVCLPDSRFGIKWNR